MNLQKVLDFDICICFDENENGQIFFSERIKNIISGIAESSLDKKQVEAAGKLSNVIELMEQRKYRAIANMLLVEWILAENGWNIAEWCEAYAGSSNVLKDENDNESQ